MEFIRGLSNLAARHRGAVVTIGAFDGLHLGHQALVARTLDWAARLARPAMMITFEPMPREFLSPDEPPPRLTSLRERWRLLQRSGLSSLCVLRFDHSLRSMPGERFIELLARDFATSAVVVGHDFRFGRGGATTAAVLQQAGKQQGFAVDILPPVLRGESRVSSSVIRAALAAGDFRSAARLLGRPYTMRGRVVQGEQLGRKLGYPTANLRIERCRAPLAGIFAVRVHGMAPSAAARNGVASLGTRPTVGGEQPLLEAHVFDFNGDLYGQELEVEFIAKLRNEENFPSLEQLVAQMHLDAADARRILAA
ncbi:MAG TPA: bifunctional riboflavin kinase/FAD synthetase [Steroidobacteraceae bacterium]|nr:bifunctional riboflavin kinase/FAD synthetase [Steroidobacteraceae bacterium]